MPKEKKKTNTNQNNRRGLIIYTGILIKQRRAHSSPLYQLIKLASAKQKSYTTSPRYLSEPGDASAASFSSPQPQPSGSLYGYCIPELMPLLAPLPVSQLIPGLHISPRSGGRSGQNAALGGKQQLIERRGLRGTARERKGVCVCDVCVMCV